MNNNIINDNSLSRLIAEKITEEIITGKLKPGEKLVETSYAEEFGTSRAPIREAFYLLAIDGLVERIPRKGSIVKGYTLQDMKDLLEIRMLLENLAVDRISQYGIDQQKVTKMDELIRGMESSKGNHIEYTKLNQQFHLQIIEMSNSEIIKNIYSRLGLLLKSLQKISFEAKKNMDESIKEHRMILNFLKESQFEHAKEILTKHNQNIIEYANMN